LVMKRNRMKRMTTTISKGLIETSHYTLTPPPPPQQYEPTEPNRTEPTRTKPIRSPYRTPSQRKNDPILEHIDMTS
jgi:hypothetical protein